ncbi:hypothetical protein EYV96_14500 [Dyella terrae]|uniref:Uncharacterized protein n=2 Tax=Dyella TaxID=231454 RepID=A0A4R0YS01_9GAMM|nr:hypothetical protein EYV96_14500 [Dyella terrae]TCI07817.1 hypothetical protein EZM97_24370 [Dyella soli]
MPQPPTEPTRTPRTTVWLPSPREAAQLATIYRRQRGRDTKRERWLRILGLVGTFFIHLIFLIGVILGPAYELDEHEEENVPPMVVRLIEKKPEEPPPQPPVRGTPPKEVGPVHRGSSNPTARRVTRTNAASARTDADLAPVPVPALETPVIVVKAKPAAEKPQIAAAPKPTVTVPKPAPAPEMAPVPTSVEPPQVSLPTPPVPQPVPPKFQPEPIRKPQLEGTAPVTPPASLAMPEVPPQSAPTVEAPTMAMEKAVPKPTVASLPQITRADVVSAPPEPELAAVPLPADAAPAVNVQAPTSTTTAIVPREKQTVQAPSITVAEAELEAVPLPEQVQPSMEKPQAPKLETAAPKSIALDQKPTLERPQITPEPASANAEPSKSQASAPSEASSQASASSANATANAAEASKQPGEGKSSAPNATPQGSETGTPGQPNGSERSTANNGKPGGLNLSLPPGGGKGANPGAGAGAGAGSENGGVNGTYVQLVPRGNTEVMSHGTPNIGYKATRFEKDWTPEGESSIDTALRRAVEKTTVRHTFHLPRGVRVECVIMPLLPVALFGCGDGNPPPKPVDEKVYERMTMAPSNPLVPPAPGSSTAAASPVKLDNAAACATARVSGGPLPPGCINDTLPAGRPSPAAPAKSSTVPTSWVPASDKF